MRARESVLVLTDQHSWQSFSSCPSQVGESWEPPRACGLGRMCLHTQSLSPVWLFATPMDGSPPGSSVRLQFLQVAGYKSSPNPCSVHSVQSLSCVWLFVTPWTAARQASLSITNSWSLPRLMSVESVMPPNCLNFCRPLLLLPSIFPSITVFSNESVLCIR